MNPAEAAKARREAEGLAGGLDGLLLDARRLAAAAPGLHGRRQAGQGEAFWQYREHRPQDSARVVDWRRSARGERLFVRELEREAAQTLWLWVDGGPGMDWSSDPARPTKLHRAVTLGLALAIVAERSGERVGAIGVERSVRGAGAIEQLAASLIPGQPRPARARTGGVLVLLSDFLAPLEDWTRALQQASPGPHGGVLVMLCDPAEEDFPFAGRLKLQEPGSRRETLLGKAEDARQHYQDRLAEHRRSLQALAGQYGLSLLRHRTDHSPATALAALLGAITPGR